MRTAVWEHLSGRNTPRDYSNALISTQVKEISIF
jgi:hypothetical protein